MILHYMIVQSDSEQFAIHGFRFKNYVSANIWSCV